MYLNLTSCPSSDACAIDCRTVCVYQSQALPLTSACTYPQKGLACDRQDDSRATNAFESVTVTEQGRFVRAVPVGSRTRSSAEETEAAECDKCSGIQALTTGEKAWSHHLLTRTALA